MVISLKPFEKCILHIGTEKTGTTSLQKMLFLNRLALFEQGFFVPRTLSHRTNLINHRGLTTFCLADSKFTDDGRRAAGVTDVESLTEYRRRIRNELDTELYSVEDRSMTLLLSNEHASSRLRTKEEIEVLKSLLELYTDSIIILVYLRPQFSLALSGYSEALKAGHYDVSILPSFEKSQAPVKRWASRYYFDYNMLLANWASVFGNNNVKPRLFTSRDLFNGDVVLDFASLVGFDVRKFESPSRENESLSGLALKFLEAVNRHAVETGAPLKPVTRTKLIEALRLLKDSTSDLPSREEVKRFQEQFSTSNEKLRIKWFPNHPHLFHTTFKEFPEKRIAKSLEKNDVIDILLTIIEGSKLELN